MESDFNLPRHDWRKGVVIPVEYVELLVSLRGKPITVSVYDYICDICGTHQVFSDVPPPPYGTSEASPEKLGWRLSYPDEGPQKCWCAGCKSSPEAKW